MAINKNLSSDLVPIQRVRDYLAANPPKKWVAARPEQQTPADITPTVNHLLATLNQVIATNEDKGTVPSLAQLMASAKKDADSLASAGLDTIMIASTTSKAGDAFSKVKQHIDMAFRWYDRLAFYLTPEGKDYLKSVVEVRSEGTGMDLKIHLFEHKFHENINPLNIGQWSYLKWAEQMVNENKNPLDYVVDKLLELARPQRMWPGPGSERLDVTEDLRGSIMVRVRDHVSGDEKHSAPGGLPRMWNFQVKKSRFKQVTISMDREPKDELTGWSPSVNAEYAVGLPTLRVIHSDQIYSRGMSCDFKRGTLYAMDGPSRMYCFPPSIPGKTFHSALMSGEPITSAGILVANEGRVLAVDNRSGHYQPGYQQLRFAVEYLRAHQLFDPDGFVALHLDNDDALYLSPEDFIAVANAGLPYPQVAAKVAARARQYQGLPIAPHHHDELLPLNLKFPADAKGRLKRWDTMLLKLYSTPGADLKGVLDSLRLVLTTQSGPRWQPANARENSLPRNQPSSWQKAGPRGIAPDRLYDGGTFCELPGLIDQLISDRMAQTTNPADKIVAEYQRLKLKLSALKARDSLITG